MKITAAKYLKYAKDTSGLNRQSAFVEAIFF
jgi:hypothetical protein